MVAGPPQSAGPAAKRDIATVISRVREFEDGGPVGDRSCRVTVAVVDISPIVQGAGLRRLPPAGCRIRNGLFVGQVSGGQPKLPGQEES